MTEFKPYLRPGDEPELSENALTILRSRYLVKDENGNCLETPGEMFARVAALVSDAETKYGATQSDIKDWHKTYYDLMASLKFLPNSPTLMNANRSEGMLSACFVLPIDDSVEAIFETIKQTALIQKAGGGTGFSLDRLRPSGDYISTSGGKTSGPISFWKVFSEATNAIQQGAHRRGANMAMMSIGHPDILKFLHAKEDLQAFVNFNISLKVSDKWMKKTEKSPKSFHVVTNFRTGQRYLLPKKIDIENYTIDDLHKLSSSSMPKTGSFYSVGEIWKMIIACAHNTGEPGLCFIDRINDENPTPDLGEIEATNPCGEQPLLPYEACTLGSINLSRFVDTQSGRADMDMDGLKEAINLSVRFLDNIVDACKYPTLDTTKIAQANRKIGLGVMGFADCLFKLGIKYDSLQAVEFGESIMSFVNNAARQASGELANMRGPFPNWNQSTWRTKKNLKVRNAAITCIAPTGTISIIANCSCGIEPVYSLVFRRQILNGTKMLQVNDVFKQAAEHAGIYNKQLETKIAKSGSIANMTTVPAGLRRVFRCAYDIKPEWHIKMQTAFQGHCDAAVSKTINFEKTATAAMVDKAYKLAYENGCKGITIYRAGSREQEPMCLY